MLVSINHALSNPGQFVNVTVRCEKILHHIIAGTKMSKLLSVNKLAVITSKNDLQQVYGSLNLYKFN